MSRAWITTMEDGRRNYRFHQSWLGDTDLCLERARRGLVGEMIDGPSDATSAGTSMHHAIETCLQQIIDTGQVLDKDRLLDLGQEKFTEEIAHPDFTWKKRKERAARNYIDLAITNWYEHILWKLDPWHVELSFGPYTLYEDEHRQVQLAGSIDYVDRKHGIMDWKTGSAHSWSGKDWEKQRWAIQPTVYTWGFNQWLLENDQAAADIPMRFTFVAMLDNGAIQKVPVERRPEDWAWLQTKVREIVQLIEADLPSWPRTDSHALCSTKWCPAFASCKGADVHASWPK